VGGQGQARARAPLLLADLIISPLNLIIWGCVNDLAVEKGVAGAWEAVFVMVYDLGLE
jgi:hypothetical protein